MKKIIHKYLFDNYFWLDNMIHITPERMVTVHTVSRDLIMVFGMTKKQTKWYLKSWCKRNKSFNFKEAWEVRLRRILKGRTFMDAGYIYAPYIPITLDPVINEPQHQPTTQITSRYATRTVDNRFYGQINLVN